MKRWQAYEPLRGMVHDSGALMVYNCQAAGAVTISGGSVKHQRNNNLLLSTAGYTTRCMAVHHKDFIPQMYRFLSRRIFWPVLLLTLGAVPLAHSAPLFEFPAVTHVQPPGMQTAPARGGKLPKLIMGLELLSDEYQSYLLQRDQSMQQGKPVKPFASTHTLARVINEYVVIDAVAIGDAAQLVAELRALGALSIAYYGRLVSALVPLNALPRLAQLASLGTARPALSMTQTGSVSSQGDSAMLSDIARTRYGVDGSGVTVGVLSDSYDCKGGAAAGVSSGDLPAGVNVLLDDAGTGCSSNDEGRAMLEIVHDVAPGAGLAFHTANLGEASFAQGILDLVNNANAGVIVDDVIYLAEPMFQDGTIAQAVDQAGTQNVSYFSAAGNQASSSYEADFAAGASYLQNAFSRGTPSAPRFAGGVAHDFSGSGDYFQQITLQPGASLTLVLEWQNAFPSLGGANPVDDDLDVYLLDASFLVVAGSVIDQSTGADPVEIFGLNYTGTSPVTANLMIVRHSGSGPGRLKYVMYKSGVSIDEYNTASGTVYGHANAASARATGAAYYASTPAYGVSPPVLESYSSRGGTPIFFDAGGTALPAMIDRHKPEIVAPDGANTTFFYPGSDRDGDGYPNFSGTSAAAPHVGAVAALLKSAYPSALPVQIYEALQESAVDMKTEGFDVDSGFGLIEASKAMDFLSSQDNAVLLGFSSLLDGTPLLSGATFPSTEYAIRGVTIADNDVTPNEISINYVATATAGIKGNFVQVDGGSPQLTLTFSPPVNHVQFDFVSSDGIAGIVVYDNVDSAILTTSFNGDQVFATTGLTGLAGHVNVTTQSPMSKLQVDASAIDNLQFGNVSLPPVTQQVPSLPAFAAWLLFFGLLGIGVARTRCVSYAL